MSIEISGLRKCYGNTVAVAGSDLTVGHGEMLVLLGPSGCGKTTTMRCVAGLERPDAGRIRIAGEVVFDAAQRINIPANKRRAGMVFQSYAIWPHLTVSQNIGFPLTMSGVRKGELRDRVEEMMALVGLEGLAERGASYLSGGQMQRVALARSLVMEPRVLLFDEPLSNLDARLRDHLRIQLREIQSRMKITSIYVTHDQREALALADTIIVMEKGDIRLNGDPVTIYSEPSDAKIADFLGFSNIFPLDDVARAECGLSGRLQAGGLEVFSLDVRAPTRSMSACIRPEHVGIGLVGGEQASVATDDNLVEGTVVVASFLGSQMHYVVRTDNELNWEVLTPVCDAGIAENNRVRLRVPKRHMRFLAASETAQ